MIYINDRMQGIYVRSQNIDCTSTKNEDGTVIYDTESNKDKAAMFQSICSMIKTSDFKTELGEIVLNHIPA